MEDESEIVLGILDDILGNHKLHYPSKGQISYNCPICDEGRNKGNLEINYYKYVYKCWSCCDVNDMHGPLGKLIETYGNKKQRKMFDLVKPNENEYYSPPKPKIKLPEEYTLFSESNPKYPVRNESYNYLKSRGITDEIIERYKIGFCDKGEHMGRIIVPSYNKDGELNYYISRSWNPKSKVKYKNPEAEKSIIIFNENLIDWEEDIYLVEGVFDGFFLKNSIPLLGKVLSEYLFERLYVESKKDIIIVLDGDAWDNSIKLYRQLNGGRLLNRIKITKLPLDKDVCDLRGNIDNYFYEMR